LEDVSVGIEQRHDPDRARVDERAQLRRRGVAVEERARQVQRHFDAHELARVMAADDQHVGLAGIVGERRIRDHERRNVTAFERAGRGSRCGTGPDAAPCIESSARDRFGIRVVRTEIGIGEQRAPSGVEIECHRRDRESELHETLLGGAIGDDIRDTRIRVVARDLDAGALQVAQRPWTPRRDGDQTRPAARADRRSDGEGRDRSTGRGVATACVSYEGGTPPMKPCWR
jgi:hypothetical protein